MTGIRAVFLCVLAPSAYAQDNLQLTHSDDYAKWFIRNTSNQTITAYIYHAGDEPMRLLNGQNVGVGELEFEPLLPGTSREVQIRPGYQKAKTSSTSTG